MKIKLRKKNEKGIYKRMRKILKKSKIKHKFKLIVRIDGNIKKTYEKMWYKWKKIKKMKSKC